jgi:glycosidase
MPKINCDHPEVRSAFLDVTRYWMETAHIDGWRLDVSNEVSHDFWRAFRKTVKSINEDAIIIGENWDNSNPWLAGDQYDAVMNYGLLFPLWQTFGSIPGMPAYDAHAFVDAVNALWVTYPRHVALSMYNLVDSHDTSRMLSLTGGSIDRFKQAYLFLFAYPGSPSVFYGDEVGLNGNHDPDNRKPMPWGRFNDEIQSWFSWLTQWRHEEDALKSDDFSLTSEGDIITMRRQNLTLLWNLGDDTTLSDNQTRMRMDASDSTLKKDGFALLKKNLN